MTTFLLIRHGSHDLLGRSLAGRSPGVRLNGRGLQEAELLAERLGGASLHALYASERDRARETAAPLAARKNLEIQISPGIDEIDFGGWTRRTFAELADEPQWALWNSRRSAAQIPGGETIGAVQTRAVAELRRLATKHPEEIVALVSHCDVIKAALAAYLAISLDELERFDIGPAFISVILLAEKWSKVTLMNGGGEFSG